MQELKELSEKIKNLDEQVKSVEDELYMKMLCIPNVPNENVPQGTTDEDNIEVRKFLEPRKY